MALKNREFGQFFLAFSDNQLTMYVDGGRYLYLGSTNSLGWGTNFDVYGSQFKKEVNAKWLKLHGYDKKILDKMLKMGYNKLKNEV